MSRRQGFTLVELLVVIAIIGVLIALLLPAVQSARESARNLQCKNHLKQLGLAAQVYHDAYKFYPARVTDVFNDEGLNPRGTWITQILPFIEQTALHDQWRDAVAKRDRGALGAVVRSPVATLYCPTRRQPAAYPLNGGGVSGTERSLYNTDRASRTDYAINGGAARGAGVFQTTRPGIQDPKKVVGVKDVIDGASNTYFGGEKTMTIDNYTNGRDEGDASSIFMCSRGACVRYAKNSPVHDHSHNCFVCHDFGSAHTQSWNAVFCDGSVRSMKYDMDFEIHAALATREDGETVQIPD